MAWRVTTIEPSVINTNYYALVEHPVDYVANDVDLVADPDPRIRRRYNLDYTYRRGAPGGIDIWDTGVEYTGVDPQPADIVATIDGGEKKKETPTLADGVGGGGGKAGKRYKAKFLRSYTYGSRSKTA